MEGLEFNILQDIGSWAVLVALLWAIAVKGTPAFLKQLSEQRETFKEELFSQRESFKTDLKEQRKDFNAELARQREEFKSMLESILLRVDRLEIIAEKFKGNMS